MAFELIGGNGQSHYQRKGLALMSFADYKKL